MYESKSFKQGICDGLFNRPSNSPHKTFVEQADYIKGFLRGQEAGKGILGREFSHE